MKFTNEPLLSIVPVLQERLSRNGSVTFEAIDPDLFSGYYAGECVYIGETLFLYRSLRAWCELAELLSCRMLIPVKTDRSTIRITYEKLGDDSFHHDASDREKYGKDSLFFRIHKSEEPTFYHYFKEALEHTSIERREAILDLGINRGDEFGFIRSVLGETHFKACRFTGVDHSQSAIEEAKKRFPYENIRFLTEDINRLDKSLDERFDLLISIGTLQSPGIAFKPTLMHLVGRFLSYDSALILGFPNSRWQSGELRYGAKAAHYNFSEMGVVLEDIIFAKRYLQQKKFRVMITGKQYLFLTAVRIGVESSQHA